MREDRRGAERKADPGNTGRPSDPIEDLPEDRGADRAAGEVAGEMDATGRPRSAVAARLTKPVAVAWAKKVPTPTRTMPTKTAARLGSRSSGKPTPARTSEPHSVGRVP